MSDEFENATFNLMMKSSTKLQTKLVNTPAKKYKSGMGQAVADRTINRKVIHKLRRPEILIIKLKYHETLYFYFIS